MISAPAIAGVFHLADGPFEHFIVVHPQGYTGAGGAIDIKVCAAPGAGITMPALRQAVSVWDDLTPSTENCDGECRALEQGPGDSAEPFEMAAVLLHELGHCAMGCASGRVEHPDGHVLSDSDGFGLFRPDGR